MHYNHPMATRLVRSSGLAVLLACLAAVAPHAQPTKTHSGTMVIAVDPAKPMTLKPADLETLPRTSVKVDADGQTVTYEGVLVAELLKRAAAPLGPQLRGDAVASYVVATATDGYRALFSLAELDPAFTGSQIMVADRVDGKPLFSYQGPFRIVAPQDRAGARSVRMLERIDVVRLPKP